MNNGDKIIFSTFMMRFTFNVAMVFSFTSLNKL